jgi:cytochrome c oxidase cbb3-type subunit III
MSNTRVLAASLLTVVAAAVLPLSARQGGGPMPRQVVDAAAATRGRAVYAQHCINCHGSAAKGTEKGPDLIRSSVVLRDRLGNGIGPAIRKSATHQADLTDAQVLELSHFLHQRIEAIATNRNPRAPINVLTGNPEAGRAYFNGAGTCSSCHSATGDFAGLATRIPDPVTLQQRFLFPSLRRAGPKQVEITVTPAGGRAIKGLLVRIDDFFVSLRDASGDHQTIARAPGVTVTIDDPLSRHHELLDRYTDADMHNVVAYLSTLK